MLKKIKFGLTVLVFLTVITMPLGQLDSFFELSLFARTILLLAIVFVSLAGGYFVVYHGGGKRIVQSLRL